MKLWLLLSRIVSTSSTHKKRCASGVRSIGGGEDGVKQVHEQEHDYVYVDVDVYVLVLVLLND